MNCIKCGKATAAGHVFCDECLEVMEQYPIKPGTPVHIPARKVNLAEKKPSRSQELSPAEALRQHKRLIKWLLLILAGCVLVIGALSLLLYYTATRGTLPDVARFFK